MSWIARLGKRRWPSLQFAAVREKKNAATNNPSSLQISAIVCSSAVFPFPAGPSSKMIVAESILLLILSMIHAIISSRVPGKQPGWSCGVAFELCNEALGMDRMRSSISVIYSAQ